jgi:hypothetical protein
MTEEIKNKLNEEKFHRGRIIEDYGDHTQLVDFSLCENFVEGVEWYLNNIWHDEKETPEKEKNIIMLLNPSIGGRFYASHLKDNGEPYWNLYDGYCVKEVSPARWCYVEDLLNNKKEE